MFLLGSSVYTILVSTSRAEKVKKLLRCETKKVEVTQWLLTLPTELSYIVSTLNQSNSVKHTT